MAPSERSIRKPLNVDLLFTLPAELRIQIYKELLDDEDRLYPDWMHGRNCSWLLSSRQLFEEAAPFVYSRLPNDQISTGYSKSFFFQPARYQYKHFRDQYGVQNAPYAVSMARRMVQEADVDICVAGTAFNGNNVFDMSFQDFKIWYDTCLKAFWQVPHLRKLTIYFYVDVDPSLNMDDDDDDANYARFILAVRTAIRKVDQLSTLGREFLEHLTDWKLKLHYMADAIQRATPEGSEVIGAIRPRPSHVLMEAEKLFSDMFNEKLSCQKLTWVPVIPSRPVRREQEH